MKHIVQSIFVILFTLACYIIMNSFKATELVITIHKEDESPHIIEPMKQELQNNKTSTSLSHESQQKPKDTDVYDYDESKLKYDEDKEESSEASPDNIRLTYASTVASSVKYEAAATEAQSLLSFKEKLYLIGIARYLDGRDFSLIRKYIAEGATQKELDGLWEQMGAKLPAEDYAKVYSIFLKYKR